MAEKTVDCIIPAYKPDQQLSKLLSMLLHQSYPVNRIILMNTVKPGYEGLDYSGLEKVEQYNLTEEEFDHGGTRMDGILKSDADLVLLLTQDARPLNENLVSEMVKAFSEDLVVSCYGRQLPREDCRTLEKYTRSFNYPDTSFVKSGDDLPRLGIKTYFCSDVCAMYDRKVLLELGGFTRKTIFNEDMIYAYHVISAGYKIAYAAEAEVIHSHNYSGRQQFQRNFDLAVSQADHPEVFSSVSSEKEGMKLVRKTISFLWKQKKIYLIFEFIFMSGCKYLGYFLGKRYRKLPMKFVRACSMNQNYWR